MWGLLSSLFGQGGSESSSGMAQAGGGNGMAQAGGQGGGGGPMGLISSILSGGSDALKQAEQARMANVPAAPSAAGQPMNFSPVGGSSGVQNMIPLLMQLGLGRQGQGEQVRESVLGDLYGSNVLNRR